MEKILGGIFVILILVAEYIFKFSGPHEYEVYITNNTNKTIKDLELKYETSGTIENISSIIAKSTYVCNVDTKKVKGEDAMILTYKDEYGNSYNEYIIGYLEKGYSGEVNINISSNEDNGRLHLDLDIK